MELTIVRFVGNLLVLLATTLHGCALGRLVAGGAHIYYSTMRNWRLSMRSESEIRTKRNQVIAVSLFNLFGLMLLMVGTSVMSGSTKSFVMAIVLDVLSVIWVGALTTKALRHIKEDYYPSVPLVAFALPSCAFGQVVLGLSLSFFGFM